MTAVVARGRRAAERLMQDTFAAYAPDPDNPTTDADGYTVPGWSNEGTTLGKVSGRTRESDTNTRTVTVGGIDRPVLGGGLHIPLDAPVPAIGWEYLLVTPGPLTDPALAGTRWRVVDVPAKSYATARRLDVVEVS